MRRLLLPAGLALILHTLLLSTGAGWLKKKSANLITPRPITLSLSCLKPQKTAVLAAQKPVDIQEAPLPSKKDKKPDKADLKPPPKIKKKPERQPKRVPKKVQKPIRTRRKEAIKKTETVIREPKPAPVKEEKSIQPSMIPDIAPLIEMEPFHVNKGIEASPPPDPLKEAIPIYRKSPSPKYPRVARRRGYEGKVILEVHVNQEGKVSDLRLFKSSGYDTLDRAAMKSVRNWLFEPGTRGEEKVAMWVKVPIRFKLK